MNMVTQFYLLRAITNLHVGSGETNYGVIDKLIERDAATGFPCINSSGLKGAIKEKFNDKGEKLLLEVFGSDTARNRRKKDELAKEGGNTAARDDENTTQGLCHFLPAHLLALPVRSDKTPFFIATSPALVNGFLKLYADIIGNYVNKSLLEKVKDHIRKASSGFQSTPEDNPSVKVDLGQLGIDTNSNPIPNSNDNNIEGTLKTLLGSTTHPLVIVSDAHMIELCNDYNLPVIARNALEDGQSQNLWYEQVLPRESLMYFPIIWDKDRSNDFNLNGNTLQVGGNASVGYGFTKINSIS